MKNIMVTGAAGFIGSHLCERLLKNGYNITAIDNFDPFYDKAIKLRNLTEAAINFHTIQNIDIRNMFIMRNFMKDKEIECVIHLAGLAGVRPSIEQPLRFWDNNCMGTMSILEAMYDIGVDKLIFASSSSVYGNTYTIPFKEDMNVDEPISPYAATKRSCEIMINNYWQLYKLSNICLRFFTVYGPRQRPDLAIHKFAKLIMKDKPIPFYGNGTTSRDYTYITDIIDGVMGAVNLIDKEHCNHIINLGEGNAISLNNLVHLLEKEIGKEAVLNKMHRQPGDVDHTFASISKAQKMLGYKPKVTKEEGIKKFIKWFRRQNDT